MAKTLRELMMVYFKVSNHGFGTVTGFDFTKQPALRRGKAIRAKCLECQCGQIVEVRNCQITDCALWPYRMGGKARAQIPLEEIPAHENAPVSD